MTDPSTAKTLDELVTLVRSHLEPAVVLITRVTEDRQYILAHSGRPLPDWFLQSTSLEYSICNHIVAMDFPLVIDDTFSHPLMHGNLAVEEMGIAAYLGAPVHVQQGKAMGALCAIEFHQRRWTEKDIEFITSAARVADQLVANLL